MGNHPARDPMQSGNPDDACHRSLTDPNAPSPGPKREGTRPGIEHYRDLPDMIKKDPQTPAPFNGPEYTIPEEGHRSPEWGPDDGFFWGIPWYFQRTNQYDRRPASEGPNGTWNFGDCSMERLIDGAARYNGGGDPEYREKIKQALKASGCSK